jgi:hypothetical protein
MIRPTLNCGAWISTTQYDAPLPKDGQTVLIWYRQAPNGWRVYLGHYSHLLKQWRPEGGNGNFNDDISHWMPLPEEPKS